MLKKLAVWFTFFALSLFISNKLLYIEQGKAFFYIDVIACIGCIVVCIAILVVCGLGSGKSAEANGLSFLVVLASAGMYIITLITTWGATKLFEVDFFVAYQIITFGQCISDYSFWSVIMSASTKKQDAKWEWLNPKK